MKAVKLKQYLLGVCIGSLLVGIGACKKTFNTEPPTALVPEDLLGANANQTILNGIYRFLRDEIPFLMITQDVMGEDMGESLSSSVFAGDYQYSGITNFQNGRSGRIWSFFYRIADNTNQVLIRADVPNPQKGQALALRAFAYFNLVNYYTAEPYKEAPDNLAVPLYLAPVREPENRERTGVIYAQIVQDLEAAVLLLSGFPAPRKSVIDQSAAYGLLARVYLFMEEWQKAADAAKKALSGGNERYAFNGADLMSPAEFQSGFNSVNNSECMWGLPTNEAQQMGVSSFFSYMDPFVKGQAGGGRYKFMSQLLYDTMHPSDVRKSVIAKPLKAGTLSVITGDLIQMKFRDPAVPYAIAQACNNARTSAERVGFFQNLSNAWLGENILMRKAEMYLIYAEACGKLNRTDQMKTALQALRTKRGVPNGMGNLTIDTVYLERRKELFGEGFRFFDLKRLKLPSDRTKGGHLPSVVVNAYISANAADSMRFRIPQSEIYQNPYIGQLDN